MTQEPIHVLLVEDDPDQAELIQRVLKRQVPPVWVTAVTRGDDCLEKLSHNAYAAVLLDYGLPGMNGLNVLKQIGCRGYSLPVIMVTGQGDERVAVAAMQEGASDYLIKTSGYLTTLPIMLFKVLKQHKLARENVRLYKETQQNLERIRALREIDQAITSTLDLDTVLGVLLEKIDLLLPYSTATVRLFNKESGLLEPVACKSLDEEEWKAERWKAGRGTANVVFETRAPVMVRNIQTDPRVRDPEFFRKHGLVSYLGVPLIAKDEILGVLSFYTKEEHEFSNEEVEFLTTLAGQAAIAIHNSKVYEEMAKLASDLSRSNRVKDEFLSVMSHELRTPLNVVMGYTGMIRDRLLGEINPEQEKALEKVISRARDQLTMISSILQATQMEAEGVRVESREVGLKDFLDDLRSSYSIPLGKELSVIWDYPLDLPVVHTDAEKLKHVLQNLINNAIKFTPRGHVTVSARCLNGARIDAGGKQQTGSDGCEAVRITVADNGIGIAKEFFPVIFERFRQVDSSETRSYGGVGIGLYIVKKFTELLGGKVEVESEPGKGSTFTVTIPCGSYQSVVDQQGLLAQGRELDA